MIYSDIEILDDDLALDDVQARIIYDRDVILQDLQHALRESGLLTALIGERSPARRKLAEQKIVALAEDDKRIVPGSVILTAEAGGYLLAGRTYEFGTFSEALQYE
ncbi:DUF2590 family protein [Victivallis sp. Marseille-Q1083]|uniref:DUF2590 family protein n=1 Tax=Victivallis sp. Marseille-Q1083 TaxID=2717288 RepID=UPI00158CA506|nr:DUF2590 family protein [Victivallis sp. Marseille-Q1083]